MLNRNYEGYKDVRFLEWRGVLYKVVGFLTRDSIIIEPMERAKCECGRDLPQDEHAHIIESPNFLDGLNATYTAVQNDDKINK